MACAGLALAVEHTIVGPERQIGEKERGVLPVEQQPPLNLTAVACKEGDRHAVGMCHAVGTYRLLPDSDATGRSRGLGIQQTAQMIFHKTRRENMETEEIREVHARIKTQ